MIILKTVFVFVLLQIIQKIDGLGIRQLNGSQRLTVTPVISTVTTRPGAVGASLGITAGAGTDTSNAVSTTTTTSGTTISSGVTPNTIGNGSLNVLRRGTEFVADQIVGALGGIATLATALDNYSADGNIYLGNLGSSVQALTERLLNLGYNAATTLIQELSTQATSTPMFRRINIRPGRFFTRSTGQGNGGALLLNTFQTQPRRNFGFASRVNGNNLSTLDSDELPIPVRTTAGANTMGIGGTDFSADNLTSLLQSAMTPFTSASTGTTGRISGGLQSGGQSSLSAGFSPASSLRVDVTPASSLGVNVTPASSIRVDTTSSTSSSESNDSSERL